VIKCNRNCRVFDCFCGEKDIFVELGEKIRLDSQVKFNWLGNFNNFVLI